MLPSDEFSGVICPCCGGHFAAFVPCGLAGRPNARCPRCGARARHRLIWLYLAAETDLLRERLTVLHFAPERSLARSLASLQNLHYVSADLGHTPAKVRMDIGRIACLDSCVDIVLCSDVLEHVVEDERAMRELARILSPRGLAIVHVPVDTTREHTFEDWNIVTPEARLAHFGDPDHVRVYGRDFEARLERAGFAVTPVPYARLLGSEARRRYGLTERHGLWACRRKEGPPGGRHALSRSAIA